MYAEIDIGFDTLFFVVFLKSKHLHFGIVCLWFICIWCCLSGSKMTLMNLFACLFGALTENFLISHCFHIHIHNFHWDIFESTLWRYPKEIATETRAIYCHTHTLFFNTSLKAHAHILYCMNKKRTQMKTPPNTDRVDMENREEKSHKKKRSRYPFLSSKCLIHVVPLNRTTDLID